MLSAYYIAFIVGALIGSFLNVVGLRFLREESIVWPGSHCYSCNTAIKPYDNIPILSWFILGGKCRACKAPISPQYPAIELLTASLFVATTMKFGFGVHTAFMLYLICNFIVILITDFRDHSIFDINSIGIIPFGLFYNVMNFNQVSLVSAYPLGFTSINLPDNFVSSLLAVVGAFVIFFALNLLSRLMIGKPGFGEGDTRLLMGIGAFVGVKLMAIVFLLSFIVQVVFGIPLLLYQWFRCKAYKTIGLMIGGFTLALAPYVLQIWIPRGEIIGLLALVLGVVAMFCVLKAIKQAKDLPSGLTYLPFGPAIVFAGLVIIFFPEQVLRFFPR